MSYYFGIPLDYADNHSGTTSMLAFEVYGTREVSYPWLRVAHLEKTDIN
jgi:hypothetical protein